MERMRTFANRCEGFLCVEKIEMNLIKKENKKEKIYVAKRKLKAFGNKLCFCLCSFIPIKKNRVAVCTFEGKGGFGCNPRYIVEELNKRKEKCEFIWFVNDMSKEFPDYIKKVPNTLWSRAYWLSTSKVWIDNYRKPYGTRKRKSQYYVNTWHANIGFKSIGLWRGEAFSTMAYLVSKNDSDMINHVVIDSEFCKQMFPRGLVYNGEFIEAGQPRCDVLYGDRKKYKESFRMKRNIPIDAKIVMFAPTFREGIKNGKRSVFSEVWSLDFERMLSNLETTFGGVWYLCVRVHPQLASIMSEYKNESIQEKVIDASSEDDMYEVLAAMDVFVTDYSSAALDASYCDMPVFIYADDIEEYLNDRGSLLWDMTPDTEKVIKNNKLMTPKIDAVLPYPIAKNNDELEQRILSFDVKRYAKDMEKFRADVGLIFDGKASEKVASKIISVMSN